MYDWHTVRDQLCYKTELKLFHSIELRNHCQTNYAALVSQKFVENVLFYSLELSVFFIDVYRHTLNNTNRQVN